MADSLEVDTGAEVAEDVASDVPQPPVIQVLAGGWHTCHFNNGVLRCWGYGRQAQLGIGTTANALLPTIVNAADLAQVAAGSTSTVYVQKSGNVLYAGPDQVDLEKQITTPVVVGAGGARLLSKGFGRHHCFQTQTGAYQCFGHNQFGQVTTVSPGGLAVMPPLTIAALAGARLVAAGQFFTCAAFDSEVRCAGRNDVGQLGDGSNLPFRAEYKPVSSIGMVKELAAGYGHACVVTADDRVMCWGWNLRGQIGEGPLDQRKTPVEVPVPGRVVQLRPGHAHTCALLDDGRVVCWGANDEGQLGNGSTTSERKPVFVTDLADAVELAVGSSHACARRSDESVWCWGGNDQGQLGDGTTTARTTPIRVPL